MKPKLIGKWFLPWPDVRHTTNTQVDDAIIAAIIYVSLVFIAASIFGVVFAFSYLCR